MASARRPSGSSTRALKRQLHARTPGWQPIVGLLFVIAIAISFPLALLAAGRIRDAFEDLDPSLVEPSMPVAIVIWLGLIGALLWRVRRVRGRTELLHRRYRPSCDARDLAVRGLAVIPETPFFIAITALSGSLAGLAGLVAGLRRSDGFRPVDRYRLRQIVEFAFANALLALGLFPLITLFGSDAAVRIGSLAAAVYLVVVAIVLARRMRREAIQATTWFRFVVALDIATILAIVAGIASGSIVAYEIVMLTLLARPMLAFLFVLASFDTGPTGE